jgi:hypothetical protein
LYKIHKLYKDKLDMIECHAVECKNLWCENLRSCAMRCKSLLEEKNNHITSLKSKAEEMVTKAEKLKLSVSVKMSIISAIKDEFEKSLKHIEDDTDTSIKILKLSFKEKKIEPDVATLSELDRKISFYASKVSDQELQEVKRSYDAEYANIDYAISKQIQNECDQYWMEGLRIN